MAGRQAGAWFRGSAIKTAFGARIQDQRAALRDDALHIANAFHEVSAEIRRVAVGRGRLRIAAFGRAPFGQPFRQTAIQHSRLFMPKQLHQPPATRRGLQPFLIIEDHARRITDAHFAHQPREAASGWGHMGQIGVRIGHHINIEKTRAWDMRFAILGQAVKRFIRQVFGGVEDYQIRRAKCLGQPFG